MSYKPLNSLIELNQYVIKESFVDSTYISIQFDRDVIISFHVYEMTKNIGSIKEFEEIEVAYKIREIYNDKGLLSKLIIIETEKPITGYVVIL